MRNDPSGQLLLPAVLSVGGLVAMGPAATGAQLGGAARRSAVGHQAPKWRWAGAADGA